MQHFVFTGPDGQELVMRDVEVTDLADDGQYCIASRNGPYSLQGIKPGGVGRLVDDQGADIVPALPSHPDTVPADILAALQILLGGG